MCGSWASTYLTHNVASLGGGTPSLPGEPVSAREEVMPQPGTDLTAPAAAAAAGASCGAARVPSQSGGRWATWGPTLPATAGHGPWGTHGLLRASGWTAAPRVLRAAQAALRSVLPMMHL